MTQLSNYAETEIADWLGGNGAPGTVSAVYVKLHTGDPGEAGTGNAATHTTRIAASFGAASGGVVATDADVEFTSLTAQETISHVSLWDAETDGNCLAYGALDTGQDVNVGGTLTIATGDLDITIT